MKQALQAHQHQADRAVAADPVAATLGQGLVDQGIERRIIEALPPGVSALEDVGDGGTQDVDRARLPVAVTALA